MSKHVKIRVCLTLFVLAVISMVIGITSSENAYAIRCCEDCDPNLQACYGTCYYSECFAMCDSQYEYCLGHCVTCN